METWYIVQMINVLNIFLFLIFDGVGGYLPASNVYINQDAPPIVQASVIPSNNDAIPVVQGQAIDSYTTSR